MKIFKYRWLNHTLFWIFIFAFYTVPRIASFGLSKDAFVNILYIPVDIVTAYFVIEFLMPRFIMKKRRFFVFIAGTLLAIAANIAVSHYMMYNVQPVLGFWTVKTRFVVELFDWLLSSFMIVGIASALKLFSYSYQIQLKQSELERRNVNSELGVLRSQINPHFLFNVLNNIDSLIFEDREKASNAIFLLSKIMRYMLKESNEENVLLQNELEYIQNYLELGRLSFENPEFLEFKYSGDFKNKQVPPLLFIPIIENTIKHCNKQSESPGIKISFIAGDKKIELKTSNYIKRNDFKLPEAGSGNGLKNVEKRLKLLYGENYVFDINTNLDKFEVYLKIPVL